MPVGGDRKGDAMAWDFSTDPDLQARLDVLDAFTPIGAS